MKKIILALSFVLLFGAGCRQTSVNNTQKSLNYYLQNFSNAPQVEVAELEKRENLVLAFAVKLKIVSCNPTDESDENFLCCNQTTKKYTPTVNFYTWSSTNWQNGGKVEFYIDAAGGMCADGGFLSARGPFIDDLLRLSQESSAQ